MDRKNSIGSPQEVLVLCREKDVRAVDLRYTDLFGKQHHKTVPVRMLSEEAFENGFSFDDLNLAGTSSAESADVLLLPQPHTAWIDPFCAVSTIVLTCSIQEPITREEHRFDPRSVANRAESYLASTGIADEVAVGTQAEFFIFDRVRYDQTPNTAFYEVDSYEASWNRSPIPPTQSIAGHGMRAAESFFPCNPADHTSEMRGEMMQALLGCGILVESQHHAVATPGQAGIRLQPMSLIQLSDALMTFKYLVKNVAHRHGRSVTFMPKPLVGRHASGLHIAMGLWKTGNPIFAGHGFAGLSEIGLYAVGGILKHARALLALTNPTTNSYKRLSAVGSAPVNIGYSCKQPTAACRIPMSSLSPSSKRVEFRCPDPSCNPYLATAALLMAVIDGIQNKIDPGEPLENLTENSHGAETPGPQTPSTLEAALIALENDSEFLIRGEVFSEEILTNWIQAKRSNELTPMRSRPHPYEFCLYYDV